MIIYDRWSYIKLLWTVTVGIASETLNDWADEEAGLEAVQRVLDSLDDIHALQDEYVDEHVLRSMLTDNRLAALLQVRNIMRSLSMKINSQSKEIGSRSVETKTEKLIANVSLSLISYLPLADAKWFEWHAILQTAVW